MPENIEEKALSHKEEQSVPARAIPPRKAEIYPHTGIWVECVTCGKNVCVGFGYTAATMLRARLFEILIKFGWRVGPKLQCEICRKLGRKIP